MAMYNIDGEPVASGYNYFGRPIATAYDVDGRAVTTEVNYDSYSISDLFSVQIANMQGFDIFGGVIFQFRANSSSVNNLMCTVSLSNASIIQNSIAVSSDHGDSASFSDEYYSESDAFPLLYVTSDTNPAKVYVNRVTENSATLVRTLLFPIDKTGYYAAAAIDSANGIIYMIGYSEQNYLSDNSGSNKIVISKWDMSNLSDNGDGTYNPQFVSSVERDFIYCTQGQQFYDGMIWIASGYTGSVGSYIYAIDKTTGALIHTINLNTTTEVEGLAFTSPTEMVVGFQGGVYKKVVFGINNDT